MGPIAKLVMLAERNNFSEEWEKYNLLNWYVGLAGVFAAPTFSNTAVNNANNARQADEAVPLPCVGTWHAMRDYQGMERNWE